MGVRLAFDRRTGFLVRRRLQRTAAWTTATVVVLLLLATLSPLAGSLRTARVVGHVTGEGGRPLGGARVRLSALTGSADLTVEVGGDGAFLFPRVPAGRYRIEVAYDGQRVGTNLPVRFEAGETYTLDLPMVPPDEP